MYNIIIENIHSTSLSPQHNTQKQIQFEFNLDKSEDDISLSCVKLRYWILWKLHV